MNFQDKYESFHKEWNIYNPKNEIYKINTFDDGKKQYKNYKNEWLKYGDGHNGQKIALLNKENINIQIGSISNWKVDLFYNEVNNLPS